jgi:hypothetical protein
MSDDLVKRLLAVEWSVTGEPCADGNVDETCAKEAANRIEELEAARDTMGNLWAQENAARIAAEAKLATAREYALRQAAHAGYVECAKTRHVTLGGAVSDAILAMIEAKP